MKAAIRQRAQELGFEECRVTTAAPPAGAESFRCWLAAGCHGEMAYLARNAHKRTNPQLVLSGARSIVTLATAYGEVRDPKSEVQSLTPAGPDSPSGLSPLGATAAGFVARYARFADYHDVLGGRLKQLSAFVNQLGGAGTRSLWYVDTGPFLERDLAQRAGVGFIGKHTNLISRQLGNWLFLAEIISTLELEPDAPERNRCGTCSRCLAACPTQAITAPFQLEARRCISYLTIELKGPIPLELRPAIGNRIFGCDDCLVVCPWNKFAQDGQLMRDHARADLATPDLLELLALGDADFKKRFAGTPLERIRRRGLVRNVCVAVGNMGDASALPALRRAAQDSERLIAEHAAWAVEQIQRRGLFGHEPSKKA